MRTENTNDAAATEGCAAASGYVALTDGERRQIAEILDRRANDVATFKDDVERRLKEPLGDYRGSVEMALTREVKRLRSLADKVRPPNVQDDDED